MALSDDQRQYEFVKAGVHSAVEELRLLGETSKFAKLLQNGSSLIPAVPITGIGKLRLSSPVKLAIETADEINQKNKKLTAIHAIFNDCPNSETFHETFLKTLIPPILEIYFGFEHQLKAVHRQVNNKESDNLQAIITLGEFCGKACFSKMVDSSCTQNLEMVIEDLKTDKLTKPAMTKWNQWTVDKLFIKSNSTTSKEVSSFNFFENPRPAYFFKMEHCSLFVVKRKHAKKFSEGTLKHMFYCTLGLDCRRQHRQMCWRRPFKSEFENAPAMDVIEILTKEDQSEHPESFVWTDRVSELKDIIYDRLNKDFSFNQMRAVWEILGGMSGTLSQIHVTTDQTREILQDFVQKQTTLISKDARQQIVAAYCGNWASYTKGDGKFVIEDIDPSLCTHLVYCFAGIDETNLTIKSRDPYQDLPENDGLDAYRRFTGLKSENENLKTLLAVGGWKERSEKFSKMAASHETRTVFIESVLNFLEVYRFDGLDVYWVFPGWRDHGGVPEDKQNFVLLLKELKEAFIPKKFLLTASVSANKRWMDDAYDVPKISQYLDYIHLTTYDMHGHWGDKTNHHSALYGLKRDDRNNANFVVNYYISCGARREQLVLCMCAHGRGFTLKDPKQNGILAPASGPSDKGLYTKQLGVLSYNEIYEQNENEPWTFRWDKSMKVPYAFRGNQWIGFDNPQSIRIKAEYIREKGLGGGIISFLEYDDFNGLYGSTYPLTRVLKDVLHSKS